MTLSELNALLVSNLTRVGDNRITGPEILEANQAIVSYFATQISDIIPDWAPGLTFQTDGTDSGKYCTHPDTNAKKRIWETKTDDNIGHEPPTNPVTTEDTYWLEVSASAGSSIQEWAAGVYGPGLVIVAHNHSVDGRGLYWLLEPVRPFNSTNIETEISGGKWELISGGGAAVPDATPSVKGKVNLPTSAVAFSSALTFDHDSIKYYEDYDADILGNLTLTLAASGHKVGTGIIFRFVADGIASINFGAAAGALDWDTAQRLNIFDGEVLPAGTYQIILINTPTGVAVNVPLNAETIKRRAVSLVSGTPNTITFNLKKQKQGKFYCDTAISSAFTIVLSNADNFEFLTFDFEASDTIYITMLSPTRMPTDSGSGWSSNILTLDIGFHTLSVWRDGTNYRASVIKDFVL